MSQNAESVIGFRPGGFLIQSGVCAQRNLGRQLARVFSRDSQRHCVGRTKFYCALLFANAIAIDPVTRSACADADAEACNIVIPKNRIPAPRRQRQFGSIFDIEFHDCPRSPVMPPDMSFNFSYVFESCTALCSPVYWTAYGEHATFHSPPPIPKQIVGGKLFAACFQGFAVILPLPSTDADAQETA